MQNVQFPIVGVNRNSGAVDTVEETESRRGSKESSYQIAGAGAQSSHPNNKWRQKRFHKLPTE